MRPKRVQAAEPVGVRGLVEERVRLQPLGEGREVVDDLFLISLVLAVEHLLHEGR